MSCFGYRRELSKYEDVDEDELLASLSPEELAELEKELTDIAPDDNVPIGLRQRDQTDKTPTGTFSREALMKYWETETRRLLEDERSGSSSKAVSEDSYLDSNNPVWASEALGHRDVLTAKVHECEVTSLERVCVDFH